MFGELSPMLVPHARAGETNEPWSSRFGYGLERPLSRWLMPIVAGWRESSLIRVSQQKSVGYKAIVESNRHFQHLMVLGKGRRYPAYYRSSYFPVREMAGPTTWETTVPPFPRAEVHSSFLSCPSEAGYPRFSSLSIGHWPHSCREALRFCSRAEGVLHLWCASTVNCCSNRYQEFTQ
jgi:hypothetical protein